MKRFLSIICMTLILSHCTAVKKTAPANTYTDPSTGFHLTWTSQFVQADKSPSGYMLPTTWRIDMRPGETGRLQASWVLKGSNAVTTAVLRYGVSGGANSFENCLQPSSGQRNVSTNQVMIGGRPFTHYQLRGAAMSHYRFVDAYRSRYAGRCYAIDLIVAGTAPQVYAPPRTAPFTLSHAKDALHQLLLRINWLTQGAFS